ncbi:hypothetical protein [Chitinophaga qingshengii]|uniref:DUF1795 domain-containing protein n=1 Tax=Chitinophaga qingshengii TaxID=1569794 RepID=A0ABR7TG59_9BACT|nr:hypothetical protein [Chitinophaga qingshengii]MBC9929402.1 hypothetical protein [Chitinophaga qingshengii]
MKPLFSLCLLLLLAASARTQYRLDSIIHNTKTARHIHVPGTRLYIIPPPGYKIATNFIGLQHKEHGMINVYDLPGGNFYTNAATFSKDGFAQKGATVFDYQELNINGYPAKFVAAQGALTHKTLALVFGDTTFSTSLIAVYPAENNAAGKELLASLKTIWYDPGQTVDPFETANFTLDTRQSPFRFFKYAANLYIYTVNGADTQADPDGPMVMVTQFPNDNTATPKDIAGMMVGKLRQFGLTNPVTRQEDSTRINNYNAYQVEVTGQMKDKPMMAYCCVVVKGNQAVVLQGISKKDLEQDLQAFKKLSATIQVK